MKAANAPRPGNWILERSLDGQTYSPWQYFAMTDRECVELYGIRATVGVPTVLGDDQVICTSRYSRLDPLEDGEVSLSRLYSLRLSFHRVSVFFFSSSILKCFSEFRQHMTDSFRFCPQIFVSLVNGRPGVFQPSRVLLVSMLFQFFN